MTLLEDAGLQNVTLTGIAPGPVSETVTITKASSTTVVTIVGGPFTYNGSAQTPATVLVTGAGGLSLTPTASYANNTVAGTATASYSYAESANHTGSSDSKGFVIQTRAVTVTADAKSKAFGATDPALTSQITSGSLVSGDIFTGTLSRTPGELAGTYAINQNTLTLSSNYALTYVGANLTVTPLVFTGFLSPIGGSVENIPSNGGSFAVPVRAFKLGSTIPAKFSIATGGTPFLTGIHTLQAIQYSSSGAAGTAIDATPTDSATTGNQFRLTDGQWHFNLSTKSGSGFSQGTWLLVATLADGTKHTVWVSIKN